MAQRRRITQLGYCRQPLAQIHLNRAIKSNIGKESMGSLPVFDCAFDRIEEKKEVLREV